MKKNSTFGTIVGGIIYKVLVGAFNLSEDIWYDMGWGTFAALASTFIVLGVAEWFYGISQANVMLVLEATLVIKLGIDLMKYTIRKKKNENV